MGKDLTLLVLAAGMGSRFGGLKQIEPVGPNGEFIIDYSIYDAIMAGFTKVVFVIKEENYDVFKETIGARIENKIKVEYAFQKLDDIPDGVVIPSDRIKPLGTAHAIYSTRNVINENFATINADDFYGRDAYFKASKFLKNCDSDEYAMVAYEVGNTLTENGEVKRGIIKLNDDYLEELIESSVYEDNNEAVVKPLEGNEFRVPLDTPVSMNLFCLTPKLIDYLKNDISNFFNDPSNDLKTSEYLLPEVVRESAKLNNKNIKVIKTSSKYLGMTYREDLEDLKNGINKFIEDGVYPKDLWS